MLSTLHSGSCQQVIWTVGKGKGSVWAGGCWRKCEAGGPLMSCWVVLLYDAAG